MDVAWRTARAPPSRRVFERVFRLWPDSGERIGPPDSFRQERDPHHREHVSRVVVGAVRDGTARRPQGGNGRNDAAVRGHAGLVRDDGARLAEKRDVSFVHVPAVRREQPGTKEAVLREKRRRTNSMVLHHEIDFGAALRQMDRVSEIVFLGKGANGLEQLGRAQLSQCGGGKHADTTLFRAVPFR